MTRNTTSVTQLPDRQHSSNINPAPILSNPTSSNLTSSKSSSASRIDTDLLIPGRGEPIKNGSLIWEGDKIKYAGPTTGVPGLYTSLQCHKFPVLMPGLWDCHVHYLGLTSTSLEQLATVPASLCGARLTRDLAATLNAGFTSVREVAGYGIDIAPAIAEGWIVGPTIYSSAVAISMTAGHADLHSHPISVVKDCMEHGMPLYVADGVDECRLAVRKQIRRGAKVIKICSTGGVLSLVDKPHNAEYCHDEIAAIVEEAGRAGLIVAAHAHGKAGIMSALHAGVRTIEHGSFLDDEAVKLMRHKDAILVATRLIVEFGLRNQDQLAEWQRAKMFEVAGAHKANYKRAVKAGVRCALGTDLGFSSTDIDHNHGMNGGEFPLAVEAGMTPLQAVEAGTANAPATLGPQAPLSGQLKAGFDADFIAVSSSPLDDIRVLARPECITHVWKGGRLCKEDGKLMEAI